MQGVSDPFGGLTRTSGLGEESYLVVNSFGLPSKQLRQLPEHTAITETLPIDNSHFSWTSQGAQDVNKRSS